MLEMVDRLVVIEDGIIVADGPKASVLEALGKRAA
jgi:energy-coupling factor transporter ATP-binding protein EcfA2